MYSEFPEVTMKATEKQRNSQRILTNITMTYLKNSGSLDSPGSCQDMPGIYDSLWSQPPSSHLTRTVIKSKKRARDKQMLASDAPPKQEGRPTPPAHPRDVNDRYKCQDNKEQETSYETGFQFLRPHRNFTSERK